MVILVDTNIVLDVFMDREPYAREARMILTKCADREVIGYLAAHSIPNLFYILTMKHNLPGSQKSADCPCQTQKS